MRRTQRVAGAMLCAGIAAAAIAMATAGSTGARTLDVAGGAVAYGAQAPQATSAQSAFAAMPLAFVQNRGQTDARVRYYALGNHYAFFATPDELMLSLTKGTPAANLALGLRFIGRSPGASILGAARAPGKVSYLTGTDPASSRSNLSRFRELVYRGLWPHIDLRLHERAGVLKYEFRLHPGARLSDIRLAYAGAKRLTLDRHRRTADHDGPRPAAGRAAGVLPADRRQAHVRAQPLRAAVRRPGHGSEVRVRGRRLPAATTI